jgi:molybdenum cofactor biosynthesis protein B
MELPDGTAAHRASAAGRPAVRCAVLTVSDTRSIATDTSGPRARTLLTEAGHQVVHHALFPNDESQVRAEVLRLIDSGLVDAVILSGGTGLSARDRTIEAVTPLFERTIPGFGELFRLVSFQEQIGSAAVLSRAVAGSARGVLIVSLPGSQAAVELALVRLLLPELAHIVHDLRR